MKLNKIKPNTRTTITNPKQAKKQTVASGHMTEIE